MESWQAREAEYMESERRELAARAQEAAGEWLGGLRPWTMFGTLTVDPKRSPPLDHWSESSKEQYRRDAQEGKGRGLAHDVMVRMVRKAFDAAEEILGHRVDYVACLEPHASGALHAHALVDTAEEGPSRADVRALWSGWYSRYGYCLFEPPRDSLRVSQYAAKYVVKGDGTGLVLSRGLGWREVPRHRRML